MLSGLSGKALIEQGGGYLEKIDWQIEWDCWWLCYGGFVQPPTIAVAQYVAVSPRLTK